MSGHSSARSEAATPPPLWLAALGAALALAGAALGAWQLERAEANRALREQFAERAALPPLRVETPPDAVDERLRFRRVELAGAYVPSRQFLLDNRVRGGEVGYEVLTPFRPDGGGTWVLVNRGWLAASPDRRVLPALDVPDDGRVVVGMLDRLPRVGLALAGAVPQDAAVQPVTVVSFPTIEQLEALLGRPLAGFQLLLDEDAPDGFARGRGPPGLPPERNLAYAGQWFLLAALAAAGAVWVVVAAIRRRKR